jgi:hypothetical protein
MEAAKVVRDQLERRAVVFLDQVRYRQTDLFTHAKGSIAST